MTQPVLAKTLTHALFQGPLFFSITYLHSPCICPRAVVIVCQLGHGSGSSGRLAPKRVESLKKFTVVGVAAGAEHTAVVTSSGNVSAHRRLHLGRVGGFCCLIVRTGGVYESP